MNAVDDAWQALRTEARGEPGWHVRRIHASASCEILAGILQPGVTPGLLLELSTDDVPAGLTLPQSRGFSVLPSVAQPGPTGRARFALALADPAYAAVFSVLCADAAGTAASVPGTRNALRAWLARLHVWQEFMSRHGAGGLGEDAAIGLYGELWFIRERLAPTIGYAAAVDAWCGPRGEPNDFSLNGGFLEVKTTAQQVPDVISVSSATQLDDRRGAILLAHVHLRADASGESLARMVSTLRSSLAESCAERIRPFNDLLLSYGYLDAQGGICERPWSVRRVDLYGVIGEFPRVRPDNLRQGVVDCTYSIETIACAPFIVDDSVLVDVMQVPGHV